jgi:hypothetical protein
MFASDGFRLIDFGEATKWGDVIEAGAPPGCWLDVSNERASSRSDLVLCATLLCRLMTGDVPNTATELANFADVSTRSYPHSIDSDAMRSACAMPCHAMPCHAKAKFVEDMKAVPPPSASAASAASAGSAGAAPASSSAAASISSASCSMTKPLLWLIIRSLATCTSISDVLPIAQKPAIELTDVTAVTQRYQRQQQLQPSKRKAHTLPVVHPAFHEIDLTPLICVCVPHHLKPRQENGRLRHSRAMRVNRRPTNPLLIRRKV